MSVNDKNLRNDLEHDVWICEDISLSTRELNFDEYMSENRQTHLTDRRFDIPLGRWAHHLLVAFCVCEMVKCGLNACLLFLSWKDYRNHTGHKDPDLSW